ncbi:hypothetical protein [Geomonas subterranea]|uniref:hypothetical protein n=1 Tax=Geomonas subterranea TaxID=2847989 RepID=UPI001CD3B23D|nr:hypothetical protein [Geomonas fuzhouensis]
MQIPTEIVQRHRETMEKHPPEESCACDPAYGRWCAFHADFRSNMSQRTLDLIKSLGQRALALHEATQDYLAYPVEANHKRLSGAVGSAETLIELYLKERAVDCEREREALRKLRETGDTQE